MRNIPKTIEAELKMSVFSSPYQKAFLNLLFTAGWFEGRLQKELKRYNLTNAQYNVLRILRGQKGKPINAFSIQERMIYATSNVTRIVEKLAGKGLIIRTFCPSNRRKIDITISEKGLAVLKAADAPVQQVLDQMEQLFSKEEMDRLNEQLEKLRRVQACDEGHETSAPEE